MVCVVVVVVVVFFCFLFDWFLLGWVGGSVDGGFFVCLFE